MRFLADTNITAFAVSALRAQGHDTLHLAERDEDPGDRAMLDEAVTAGRVLLTKDHDLGALVFRDGLAHAGVLLIDDLGSPEDEAELLCGVVASQAAELAANAFVRAGRWGSRIANEDGQA